MKKKFFPLFLWIIGITSTVTFISTPFKSRRQKIPCATTFLNMVLDPNLNQLEIKVGRIIKIDVHPEAENLYVEEVDMGEGKPRTIVSGLVKYCSVESLLNKNVVVLCNLKPRALKGVTSFGMLLCATNDDHSKVFTSFLFCFAFIFL